MCYLVQRINVFNLKIILLISLNFKCSSETPHWHIAGKNNDNSLRKDSGNQKMMWKLTNTLAIGLMQSSMYTCRIVTGWGSSSLFTRKVCMKAPHDPWVKITPYFNGNILRSAHKNHVQYTYRPILQVPLLLATISNCTVELKSKLNLICLLWMDRFELSDFLLLKNEHEDGQPSNCVAPHPRPSFSPKELNGSLLSDQNRNISTV